jgi:autotransporter translocation and assembly factor TamB
LKYRLWGLAFSPEGGIFLLMTTVTKTILLTAAALAMAMLIVFGGVHTWINSDSGRVWVETQVNQRIPGSIHIRSLRLSLLTPSVELLEASLHDARNLPLAGVQGLTAAFDWWSLWRREIRVTHLMLREPWADLAIHETSGLNLTAAVAAPDRQAVASPSDTRQAGLPFNLVVQAIRLNDGRLSFTPADAASPVTVTGIAITADGNLMTRTANLDLTVADMQLTTPAMAPTTFRMALQTRLSGNQLHINGLDIVSEAIRLHLSGSATDLFTVPHIDAEVAIDTELSQLAATFRLAGDFQGPLTTRLLLSGAVNDLQAHLQADLKNGRIAGRSVDHGKLRMRLQDRQVFVDTVGLQLVDGHVDLNGHADLRGAYASGQELLPNNLEAITYEMQLKTAIPDLTPWAAPVVDIGGRLDSRLTLHGQGLSPDAVSADLQVNGTAHHLLTAGMQRPLDAAFSAEAHLSNEALSIRSLGITADRTQIDAGGRFRWNDRTMDMALSLDAEDLSPPLAVLGLPSVKGSCRADLEATGSLTRPQFAATLEATGLSVNGYRLGDVALDADMDPSGRLNLATVSLKNGESAIHGHGRAILKSDGSILERLVVNRFDLSLQQATISDFMPSPPWDGTINGRLQAAGPLTALEASLELSGSGLPTNAIPLGSVDAGLRWEAGTVHLDRLHLRNDKSTLSAQGNIALTAPGSWQLLPDPTVAATITADHVDPGLFTEALSGDVSLRATVSGSRQDPSGQIRLSAAQLDLAGQHFESMRLEARIAAQRLWLDRFTAAIGANDRIEGRGWLDQDRRFDLQVTSTGIDATGIDWLKDRFIGEGRLQFDVAGSGSVDNPDIDGRVVLSDVSINDERFEDFSIDFSLHDRLAKASARLNFNLEAVCDLNTGDLDGSLIFDRTETAAYFRAAGQPALHGRLSGRIASAGNIKNLPDMTASVDLSQVDLYYNEISLARSERITAQLSEQTLSIPGIDLAILSTGRLKLNGEAHIGGQVDVSADGRLPIAAARVFSDALGDASGTLALTGSISGDVARPQIDARIDLEQIGMSIPGLVQRLQNLNGRITISDERIIIDALTGFLDTGSFRADGSVGLDRFVPQRLELDLNMQSLPLEIEDTLAVLLNGDITITGIDRTLDAKGDIVVLEGLYYKDVKVSLLQVTSAAATRQRPAVPERQALVIPYFDTVNLDLSIGYRQPFAVENNLAQLAINPDLRIRGTLANPIISGRAQVREGTVNFRKTTFDVQKGVIDFANPYRTEADIDIQSQAEIRSWRIYLGLKGTLDNLDISLSSVPSETEADILSLILFGRTASELTAGEGGGQQTTGQIMAEMIADNLGVDIKKSTGLDILQVETTEGSDQESENGVKVTVGKNLSDRMTVKYAVETKDGETVQRAITEYKLLEHILISGFQDKRGVYGSELAFRIEFR